MGVSPGIVPLLLSSAPDPRAVDRPPTPDLTHWPRRRARGCGFGLRLRIEELETGFLEDKPTALRDQLALEHGTALVEGQLACGFGVDAACDHNAAQVDRESRVVG